MVSIVSRVAKEAEKSASNQCAQPTMIDVPYPDRDDGFCGLKHGDKEIAHFHDWNELDLKLTKEIIRSEGLSHAPHSARDPKRDVSSDWIELRFKSKSDLDEVVRLVQLAMAVA